MPTTRRRRGRGRAGLSDALVEWFLSGEWPRNDDGTQPLGRLQLFLLRDAERRNLWLEHRAELLAEWRRRGATGLPWGTKFDDAEASRFPEEG
jgi:hypothetical protein